MIPVSASPCVCLVRLPQGSSGIKAVFVEGVNTVVRFQPSRVGLGSLSGHRDFAESLFFPGALMWKTEVLGIHPPNVLPR